MKPWLSYQFGEPEKPLPEYSPSSPFTPCHYWWRPSIYCEDLSIKTGGFYDELPIPDGAIREIWVESVRAYHLLCRRADMRDWEGIVRIIEPEPTVCTTAHDRPLQFLCLTDDSDGFLIGAHLSRTLTGGVAHLTTYCTEHGMPRTQVVVFPSRKESTSLFLCAAIASGCRIVSSDAGAAEEYLSNHAAPGTWHVVHTNDRAAYLHAVYDLLGMKSDCNRSMYVDEAPYE